MEDAQFKDILSEDVDDDYKNIIQYLLCIIIVKCCLKEEIDDMSERLASEGRDCFR